MDTELTQDKATDKKEKVMVINEREPEYSKVICANINCRHNMALSDGFYCNLKTVVIDEIGACENYLITGKA